MWYNSIISAILRSPLHGLLSGDMLVLRYTGRKSGVSRSVPVSYIQEDDTLLILSLRKRTWWRSLRGQAPVRIRLQGRDVDAVGEVVEDGATVTELLRVMVAQRRELARLYGVSQAVDTPADRERLQAVADGKVIIRLHLNDASGSA